ATPIGVLAAIFLNEYTRENWLTRVINMSVLNLAGVPSIVHALFGLGAFVLFAGLGKSVLAASLTLAVMTLLSQDAVGPSLRWNAGVLGNHRAVVRVEAPAEAVRVRIPWRRRDAAPEKKAVFVRNARTGAKVDNVTPLAITREYGEFVFQPSAGAGEYDFYYMPYRLGASRNYPQVRYIEPERTADEAWLKRLGLSNGGAPAAARALPAAKFVGLQAVDDFDAFPPMELIATAAETEALLKKSSGEAFLLFPEDRRRSIRMADDLPWPWAEGPKAVLAGDADRGEFFSFQIGVWACGRALEDVEVRFSDLRAAAGDVLSASAWRCINTGGTDWNGEPFRKPVAVAKGKVQALWCGVQVPAECAPGLYSGEATVTAKGAGPKSVRLDLTVRAALRADGGDGEPERMSRLRWLDSTLAMDDEIVRPFVPLTVSVRTIGCLGRALTLGGDGFPAGIKSFFASDVTRLVEKGRDVLAGPMAFVVEDGAGKVLSWRPVRFAFTGRAAGKVAWEFRNETGDLRLDGKAWMEMDGYVEYQVRISAAAAVSVKDIRLEIPWARDSARYMMGLGQKGGLRPPEFRWAWDQKKNQDSLWLGAVNAGMQVGLRAENYSRPLNTNFYLSKPLNMPPSWFNG
ncbi:MAG: glycoside hydrolase domain-containing protein, partial [Candidatus Aminicenantales bacterium]